MLLWLGLDLFSPTLNLYTKELVILGIIAILAESLRVNFKFNRSFIKEIWRGKQDCPPSFFSRWLTCAIVIMTLPIAHFSGYAYQLIRYKILKISDW